MIQVGSKEEIELLLALFGSKSPKEKKSRWVAPRRPFSDKRWRRAS
jgi:hypothetical protein